MSKTWAKLPILVLEDRYLKNSAARGLHACLAVALIMTSGKAGSKKNSEPLKAD
jgi:hypothetical protein